MKLVLNLEINGNDSLKCKLKSAVEKKEDIHLSMMRHIISRIIRELDISMEDDIFVSSFSLKAVDEIEKKVDN